MNILNQLDLREEIVEENEIIKPTSNNNFIEANTLKVNLEHLKNDCIIPVFSKDNETTISHYQFIEKTYEIVKNLFPDFTPSQPDIRVSHIIKGRTPSAIGKPAKELLEEEKTLYYERCAFVIELHQAKEYINGNTLTLSIGGVRAYNQENLYSKKSIEKFKIFIGYQNKVCTNLCISTDGFKNDIRITSVNELEDAVTNLAKGYNRFSHLNMMKKMSSYSINETQFAHLIGKIKMYQYLDKSKQKEIFPFGLNDGQINSVIRDYFNCTNFSKDSNGNINLWNLYNLFTEASKSSYIDNAIERNINSYEFTNYLCKMIENESSDWYNLFV